MAIKIGNSSFRYVDGTFYTLDWLELFTPLTSRQEQGFIQAVAEIEKRDGGQRITKAQLLQLAKKFDEQEVWR